MKPVLMTHDDMKIVWGWEDLVAQDSWDDVEIWWRDNYFSEDRNPTALRALLVTLEHIVPKVTVENGTERMERHIRTADSPHRWNGYENFRGAAEILELGELAAAVEGDPPKARDAWNEHRAMIEQHMASYLEADEPTAGEEAFSRRTHAKNAIEDLTAIDVLEKWMSSQLGDTLDREWLSEIIAEVTGLAFGAGRHTQAAWAKEFEPFVPTGRKVKEAQREGAAVRKGQTEPTSSDVREAMSDLIDKGHSISRAAAITAEKGLGTSAEANRKLFQRSPK